MIVVCMSFWGPIFDHALTSLRYLLLFIFIEHINKLFSIPRNITGFLLRASAVNLRL